MVPMIFLYDVEHDDYSNYERALRNAGMDCVVSRDLDVAARCAGMLMPGGDDIDESGLPAEETAAIRHFIDRKAPILGICRGLQALNVYFGGTLYEDIPRHRRTGGDEIHQTCARGLIAELMGPAPVVNSAHHQAIKVLGEGLEILQCAPDGIIEAVAHRELPIFAVQWHPERESFDRRRDDAADAAPIFAHFLSLTQQ